MEAGAKGEGKAEVVMEAGSGQEGREKVDWA